VQVSILTDVKAIACGVYHTLAITNDGKVWTWGFNLYGQLGNGTNTDSNVPVQVSGLNDITAVAGGYAHSLALTNSGVLWDWGYNNDGQLGNGTSTDSNVPIEVSGLCQVLTPVVEAKEPLRLYVSPNPFENEFTLTGTKENGSAVIYNLSGEEISRLKTGNNQTLINTALLSTGYYLLNYTADNRTTKIKLIKY
jgi:hypothetical protein